MDAPAYGTATQQGVPSVAQRGECPVVRCPEATTWTVIVWGGHLFVMGSSAEGLQRWWASIQDAFAGCALTFRDSTFDLLAHSAYWTEHLSDCLNVASSERLVRSERCGMGWASLREAQKTWFRLRPILVDAGTPHPAILTNGGRRGCLWRLGVADPKGHAPTRAQVAEVRWLRHPKAARRNQDGC